MKEPFTHASLFSGIGACELAAEWMGWTNVFNCEINPFCRTVLDYHFPKSIGYEDITKTEITGWCGRIDVLTAGFPCQPFSCAGQRRGTDDDRYLWPETIRVIREVRPSYVVGENVAGILSMVQPGDEVEVEREASLFGEGDCKRTLLRQEFVTETICRDLEREGYSVQSFVIPACAVGAPHRRDRVWFVAHRTDAGIEKVQREREDGVLSNGTFTDTTSKGHVGRSAQAGGREEDEQEWVVFANVERPCGTFASSDTDSNRRRNRTDKQEQFAQCEGKTIHCVSREDGTASNTNGNRLERERFSIFDDKKGREDQRRFLEKYPSDDRESLPSDRWHDFPAQSPVRRRYDGISTNLLRYINDKVYDELYKYFGRENLSCLCSHFQKKEIREEIGRLYKIPQPDLLLEVLQCTSKEWGCEQRPRSLSSHSERTSERVLRYLRNNREFAGVSHRQEYKEQRREQSSDIMRKLSHEFALATKKIIEECERTASWVRQESIKAYGNAIVPQVAYEIFRAIETVETK